MATEKHMRSRGKGPRLPAAYPQTLVGAKVRHEGTYTWRRLTGAGRFGQPSSIAAQALPFLRMAETASDISSRFFLPRLCVPRRLLASFRARLKVEAEPILSSSIMRRS